MHHRIDYRTDSRPGHARRPIGGTIDEGPAPVGPRRADASRGTDGRRPEAVDLTRYDARKRVAEIFPNRVSDEFEKTAGESGGRPRKSWAIVDLDHEPGARAGEPADPPA
jgi:hypothetical protein